ncbi:MAG: glycosyltransferase [Patescibacteria group bacterium]
MKIGIYDPYLDDLGGGEKYMMKIAQCFSQNNEVFVFWNEEEDFDDLKKRFLIDLSRVSLRNNIFSKNFPIWKRLIESKRYDVIILLSDGSVPFLLSKKTYIHIQQPLPRIGLDLKAKLKLSRISGIFCNSSYTKSFIDKSWGINTSILYPPVELKPKKTIKENIILHVGRFRVKNVGTEDYKKQGVMIDAFKKMIKQGLRNWKFVLAVSIRDDDKEVFDQVRESAKNLPIEFIVNRNNDELWDIYSKAKIYWHASGFGEDLKKHPEYAEHFGISTVEAMGAGAVPVVIDAGGQKEIVEEGKCGFLWNSINELIEKTSKLMENEKLLKKMSENARRRSARFAGDRFCKELEEIISK